MKSIIAFVIGMVGAILSTAAAEACAWRHHPRDRNIILFSITNSQGEVCKISDWPSPYNKPIPFLQGPRISEFRWAYADKQYGVAQIRIQADGSGELAYMFSNGKKWDGDTFCATVTFLDDNQRPILARSARVGVNSSYTGSTREVWARFPLNETQAFWRTAAFIKFQYRTCGKYNDGRIWEAWIKNTVDVVKDPSIVSAVVAGARIAAEYKSE